MWGLSARSVTVALVFAVTTGGCAEANECAAPAGCTQDALSASAFIDSVGVNTHLGYNNQVYGTAWPMVRDRLVELGVRHVRDASYRDGTRLTDVVPHMRQLASLGIRGNLLSGDPLGRYASGTIDQHLAWVRKNVAGFVESLEGPNEYDDPANDPNWERTLRTYQCEWARKIRSDSTLAGKAVIGPSSGGVGFDTLGDLTGCLDAGNLHPYPGAWEPSTSNAGDLPTHIARARKVSGSKPVWVTESGYHNATNCSCGHAPVSETASGIYVPRMFMEYFRRGIPRTYGYELIDEQPDPLRAQPQRNFGLLRNDGTRKPAFTSVRNLLAILADSGAASGRLSFGLTCESSCAAPLRHVLLRKTTGAYYLVVWRESSVWDEATRTDRSVAAQQVELQLPTPSLLEIFEPARSSTATARLTAGSHRFALADQLVVVKIDAPRGTKTDVGVPAGDVSSSAPQSAPPQSAPPQSVRPRSVAGAVAWTADNAARQLRRSGARQLRRRGVVRIAARAVRAGRYVISLERRGIFARGRRSFGGASTKRIAVRRSARGRSLLRPGARLVLHVAFVSRSGARQAVRRHVKTMR